MRKFILIILINLFFGDFSLLNSQCPPNDVILSTQADVNNFVQNYPNCSQINGILEIGSILWGFDSDVNDISGLTSIQSAYEVYINGTKLTSLDGLNNLKTIMNSLSIYDNEFLEDILALNNLETTSWISINNLPKIQSVNIFNSLQNFSGTIFVENCDNLLYLDGFFNFITLDELHIVGNASLLDISSISNLTDIIYRLDISDNAVLSDISGFNVKSVGEYFYFRNNPLLSDCTPICILLENNGVGIQSFIENNGEMCNSEAEIISSCNQAYTLTITEIMYNPPESGIDSLEFIEITNTGNLPVDLENVYFSSGINHIFNSQIINPSESIVLVGNLQAINNTLANINVYSHVEWTQWYDGSLSNNGEKIILNDPNGNIIDSLTYEDKAPWPSILDGTDGNGSSIVLCDYQTDNSIGSNWKASTFSSCYNVNDHIYRASPMRNIDCNYCYSLCTFVPDSILIGSPCDFNNGSGTIIDNCECVAINDMHLFFNDASGSVGDTIDYYLSISTFENIIGFDYSVLWNSSYIKFVALDNINTNIAGYDISNHSITDDRMNVSWSNGVPQSLPDSSTFYRMRFEVVTDRCVEDSIYLWHLPSENRINFYDSNMELLNVSKQDGVLNIYNLATLTMDYENNSIVELCYGETVNFNTATISDAKVYMECFNCSPDIDSTDFGGGDIIVQTIEPGSYSVVFFSNSTSCGRGDSIELNLVVSDPRFELEVPPSYCRGDSVEVTFIPQFLQSFENISIKNFEGEVFYEGVNLNPKFLPIGSDAYIYTAIDEYGCIYEESVDLFEVEPLDTPSITCSQTENKITFTWNDVGGTYDVNQISGPSGMLVGNTFVVENLMDGEEVTIELIVSDPNAICDDIIVPSSCTYEMDCPAASIDDINNSDAEGKAISEGNCYTIGGIVYGPNYYPSGLDFTMIEGPYNGIQVFSNTAISNYEVNEGDSIFVKGVVSFFQGLKQIEPLEIILQSSGHNLLTPLVIDSFVEANESSLIRINNLELVNENQWLGDGSSFNFDATDGIHVFEIRIDNDIDLSSMTFPVVGKFDIIGIQEQFDSTIPYFDGYQILPRNQFDIIPHDEDCTHPDYDGLMALYHSTNGDQWTNTINSDRSWDQSCDPCDGSWYGIKCNNGRVISMELPNNNLIGFLPDELASLINLEKLALPLNSLSNNIPESIFTLSNLKHIHLGSNELTGEISENIGNLSLLEYLNLSGNKLQGTIPNSLYNLITLKSVAFSFNNLSGEIPETIKNLTNLREYAVNYNNISGNIPSGFFSLQQLSGLWLHNNNLSGCFPNSLLNKCDSINYNFMNNPLLPWKGDLTPFCNGEIQIGSPCLIEGLEGEINESCECAEVMEDCMFSLLFDTLSILPFKQYDFNVLANDELPGNYTWELIKLPESVTIKDTDSIGNILFEVLENFLEPIVIEYEVCSDGCECRQSTFTIFNISIQQLTFTNIITPNGDGMDDVLRFTVEEIVKNSELWIYNRWGDRIFYMENYDNSWDASGYPGGIYFYVLRVNGVDIKKTLTIVK